MSKNFYEEEIMTPERTRQQADGLDEFRRVYLRFLIPNIPETKLKKYYKRLKKMIKTMRNEKKCHKVYNKKMVRLNSEEFGDDV